MKNRPAKIKLVYCQSIHRAVTPLPPSLTGKWGKKYVSKKKKKKKEKKRESKEGMKEHQEKKCEISDENFDSESVSLYPMIII